MKKINPGTILIIGLTVFLLMGCAAEDSGPVLLNLSGAVEVETGFTKKDLEAMGTMEVDFTDKSGETTTYTGALVADVLTEVGLSADASAVVFVGDDGYEAEATLEEVQACADCIVAFLEEGGLKMVMPGFSSKLQVKGVVELRVN